MNENISMKELDFEFPCDMKGIFLKFNFRKCKWLLFGLYGLPSQSKELFLDIVTKRIDK